MLSGSNACTVFRLNWLNTDSRTVNMHSQTHAVHMFSVSSKEGCRKVIESHSKQQGTETPGSYKALGLDSFSLFFVFS